MHLCGGSGLVVEVWTADTRAAHWSLRVHAFMSCVTRVNVQGDVCEWGLKGHHWSELVLRFQEEKF